jgi:hypothetical protein
MNLRAQSITSRLVAMVVMVTVALLFATLPRASADSVTVNSSTAVTYLYTGVCCTDFPAALTAANFASAQTGPNAVPLHHLAISLRCQAAQGLWLLPEVAPRAMARSCTR